MAKSKLNKDEPAEAAKSSKMKRPVRPLITGIAIGAAWGAASVPSTMAVAGLIEFGLTMLAVMVVAWALILLLTDFAAGLGTFAWRSVARRFAAPARRKA
jgi:hypothetical protein